MSILSMYYEEEKTGNQIVQKKKHLSSYSNVCKKQDLLMDLKNAIFAHKTEQEFLKNQKIWYFMEKEYD